jgi:uncharacterized protein YbjT (DUF2867 family)
LLRANGIRTTVLDHDGDRVELLRALGLTVYYGDATRHDLLHAAGAGHARLMVIALDSPEKTLALVHTARKHFPQLVILARAFDWSDAYDLVEAGVEHVYVTPSTPSGWHRCDGRPGFRRTTDRAARVRRRESCAFTTRREAVTSAPCDGASRNSSRCSRRIWARRT